MKPNWVQIIVLDNPHLFLTEPEPMHSLEIRPEFQQNDKATRNIFNSPKQD